MTTPEQAAAIAVDTKNLEHSGDWDHGVEPDPLAPTTQDAKDDDEPKSDSQKQSGVPLMVKKAKAAVTNVYNNVKETAHKMEEEASKALHEESLQKSVENHTEEEVAGMKLCVSKTVHQDSFIAPC